MGVSNYSCDVKKRNKKVLLFSGIMGVMGGIRYNVVCMYIKSNSNTFLA